LTGSNAGDVSKQQFPKSVSFPSECLRCKPWENRGVTGVDGEDVDPKLPGDAAWRSDWFKEFRMFDDN
jgi:hypothetical protein